MAQWSEEDVVPVWQHIAGLPKRSEKLVLAKTADGRIMVFKASILAGIMAATAKGGHPQHLQYPATHFIMCDDLLALPEGL